MGFLMNLIGLMLMVSLCSGVLVKPPIPLLDEVRAPIDESTIPRYSYAYDVQDAVTGDFKNHQESREGGVVRGSYSFIESDGSRRIVDYVADPVNGFNAVVRKEPGVAHPTGPVGPKLHLQHPHAAHPVLPPAVLPKHPSFEHVRPIPAVTAAPNPYLTIPPAIPHHLPGFNYPHHAVHPYAIHEPLTNDIYPPVAPRRFLPIGRYGYALTNAAFPLLQPH